MKRLCGKLVQTVGLRSDIIRAGLMVRDMQPSLRLYYAPDNASLCVRLLLERLGMAYETALVDRRVNGQKSPDYLALNPNGVIPTLVCGTEPVTETGAILLWLADQHPGTVFPAIDADDRAQALSCLFWLSNTVHPNLRHIFYAPQYGADARNIRHVAKETVPRHLDIAAQMLPLINRYDALACYFVPILRWISVYGRLTWEHRPALVACAKAFEARAFAQVAAAAEGLGRTPFSDPAPANPLQGSAT